VVDHRGDREDPPEAVVQALLVFHSTATLSLP
jgi:hypothetical protein